MTRVERACVQCCRNCEYCLHVETIFKKIMARGCCMHIFLVYAIILDFILFERFTYY
jgi:hypothetical protein